MKSLASSGLGAEGTEIVRQWVDGRGNGNSEVGNRPQLQAQRPGARRRGMQQFWVPVEQQELDTPWTWATTTSNFARALRVGSRFGKEGCNLGRGEELRTGKCQRNLNFI